MKTNKKPWKKKKGLPKRSVATRGSPKDSFLIICEGKETEPNYFNAFKVKSAQITVIGTGFNTISLVEEASKKVKEYKNDGMLFNQVWCVFDRDDFHEHFNEAILKARKKGFHVAYSNEAFELWYLLHFIYFDSNINRKAYIEKLNKHISKPYQKNDTEMYNILKPRQAFAIKNAKKLLSKYSLKNPNKEEPSTTVHELVEQLNRYKD